MTPEELREKITFKDTASGVGYGIRSITGRIELSHSITYDERYPVEKCAKEMITTKIMRSIYGDWQRKLYALYQEVYIQAHPLSFQFAEAEKNFLDALHIKIHPNQEHDDTRTKS